MNGQVKLSFPNGAVGLDFFANFRANSIGMRADKDKNRIRWFWACLINVVLVWQLGATAPAVPVEPDLTNPNINAFAYDPEGYMWMGTSRGLNRYNGSFFWTFLHGDSSSIVNDNIHALWLDADNRLWIGTDGGLDCYDSRSGRFCHPSDGRFNPVYALAPWRDSLLVYTDLEGFSVLSRASSRVVASMRDDDIAMSRSLAVTSAGEVWVVSASTRSVWRFGPDLGLREKYAVVVPGAIGALTELRDGSIWLATDRAVARFDADRRCFVAAGAALSVLVDGRKILFMRYVPAKDYLLLGIQGLGLFVYDPGSDSVDQVVHQKRFSGVDRCYCYVDPHQTIWLAPANKGFRVFPVSNAFENHYVHAGLNGQTIHDLGLYGSGKVWLSTERAVALFDPRTKESSLITPTGLSANVTIRQALVDTTGHQLWIWSSDHVLRKYAVRPDLSVEAQDRFQSREKIRFFWEEPESRSLWVALETKWARIGMDTGETVYFKRRPGAHFGRSYYSEALRKSFLVSYDQGIFVADRSGGLTPVFREVDNPSCLFVGRDSLVWVGSFDAGLFCFAPDGRLLRHLDTSSGLPDNSVMSLLEDEAGSIWICMKNGIVCYSGQDGSLTSFAYENFIRDAQFELGCAVRLPDNTLCFGYNGGLAIIRPDLAGQSAGRVPLGIDAVLVNREPVRFGPEGLDLAYDENFLSIYYSGRDLVNGFLLRYAYRLDGYDKSWVEAGQNRMARYTNLPPGDYTFRVRLQDVNGRWLEDELAFPVRVHPAWWNSAWAKAAYILLSLAVVYLLLSFYVRWRMNRERLALVEREKRMNERLYESKIELFSNISHEFRTPLSLVYAPLRELLEKGDWKGHDLGLLHLMRRNVERMMRLAEQLLRIDRQALSVDRLSVARFDLVPVVQALVDSFRYVAQERRIRLELEAPERLEGCLDRDKVEKILFNLVDNALKYTPEEGEVRVILSSVDEGRSLLVQVTDTGVGIPDNLRSKLFCRHERLEMDQRLPESSGFGIGLSYVRQLVVAHHGTIEWHPNERRGTCFQVVLPIVPSAYSPSELAENPDPDGLPASAIPSEGSAQADADEVERRQLLVVEDNPELRGYLGDLLGARYRVTLAVDGVEALDLLGRSIPDMVISDVLMPRKNGFELCRELKSSEEYCHLPVILLTAKTDLSDNIRGLDLGADAYIAKPFDPRYLMAVIQNIFTNRARSQSAVRELTAETLNREAGPDEVSLDERERAFLAKLYALLDTHLSDEDYNILSLAQEIGISRSSLYSKIKLLTGKSPQLFFSDYRLNRAMDFLRSGEFTVSEVGYKVGFSSLAGFSRSFKKQFGYSPSKVKREA